MVKKTEGNALPQRAIAILVDNYSEWFDFIPVKYKDDGGSDIEK